MATQSPPPNQPGQGMAVATQPPGGYPASAGYPPAQSSVGRTEEASLSDVKFDDLEKIPDIAINESQRFCFLLFNRKGDPRVQTGKMFYPEQMGVDGKVKKFPFLAPDENDPIFAQCTAKWKAPRTVSGVIVLVYNTDRQGVRLDNKYSLHALRFEERWGKWFVNNHARRSFATRDLFRTGVEEGYNKSVKYSFEVQEEGFFASAPEDFRQEILAKAEFLFQNFLAPVIGTGRPRHEIEALLRDMDPRNATPDGRYGGAPVHVWGQPPGGHAQPPAGYGQPPAGYGQPAQRPPATGPATWMGLQTGAAPPPPGGFTGGFGTVPEANVGAAAAATFGDKLTQASQAAPPATGPSAAGEPITAKASGPTTDAQAA